MYIYSNKDNTKINGCDKWLQLSYSALIWQKEASDKSDISRKRAKCVCHLHWRQWNIMMSYLTYLLVGWVFLHEIWPGRRAHYVNYENINNSNLDGTFCMSLASFCQSRAVLFSGSLITWWFLNLLVVPEKKKKVIVFSFRPIDSVVFLNIKLFHYLLTPFSWMLVQWTTEMPLFRVKKKIGGKDTL